MSSTFRYFDKEGLKRGGITLAILVAAFAAGSYLIPEDAARQAHRHEHSNMPAEWRSFAHNRFPFTFHYPRSAELTTNTERSFVKVQVTGAGQPANTEVIDGWTAWIRSIRREQATSELEHVAQQLFRKETRRSDVLKPLATTTVRGKRAYTFTARSELGNAVVHTLWRKPGNSYFHVYYSVSAPSDATYATYTNQVTTLIDTIRDRSK